MNPVSAWYDVVSPRVVARLVEETHEPTTVGHMVHTHAIPRLLVAVECEDLGDAHGCRQALTDAIAHIVRAVAETGGSVT